VAHDPAGDTNLLEGPLNQRPSAPTARFNQSSRYLPTVMRMGDRRSQRGARWAPNPVRS
jgi:hypothetical protein